MHVGVFTPAPTSPARLVACCDWFGTKNGPSPNDTAGFAAVIVPLPALVPYGGEPSDCATTAAAARSASTGSAMRTGIFTRHLGGVAEVREGVFAVLHRQGPAGRRLSSSE